ncbi:hypothetical protein Tdes44962_MAKER05705 [Teratosphaeria destructans]|uniref:Uncharacterized protein n=1 Tax=Teratosphaeria destructans TaxID=418781 RepID=A0A9W7SJ62_9PEZI|nr:hypothetical protein Tdes44962_MAKER05705 [Teratosphaeria destructans]
MFAPTPLSKADIEKLRAAKLAREAKKESPSESSPSPDTRRTASNSSLQRADTQSPRTSVKSGFSLFSRNSKQRFSKPISTPVPDIPTSPEQAPKERKVSFSESTRTITPVAAPAVPKLASGPVSFAEQPRRAPEPPKKPQRAEDVLSTTPQRSRGSSFPHSPPNSSPPAIPEKSPRRPSVGTRKVQHSNTEPVTATLGQLSTKGGVANDGGERPARPSRAPTAPLASAGKGAVSNARSRRSMVDPDKRLSGVRGGNVEKGHSRHSSGTASIRSTLDELDDFQGKLPRRATDGQTSPTKAVPTSSPADMQLPWKRRKKGETMSMLLESGFFEKDMLADEDAGGEYDVRVKVPPPLFSLPATPGSAAGTPTEIYQSKRASMNARKRVSSRSKRSPLAQISTTNHKTNAKAVGQGGSPSSDLHAIPELNRGSENSLPASDVSTPTLQSTQIHVRDGSIVTVTPPELTAYQRHVYLQGPIRLSKPVIAPRKNSVASLEAFQEAIDKVYQDALVIPRRRSDDAVIDDVCDWFESFGFDPVGYDGDIIMADLTLDEIDEVEETNPDFASPTEIVTPVEARLAKEVVSRPVAPPVSTEEALRAKGKRVHMSHASGDIKESRRESMTLADGASILSVTSPRPESFGPDALMAIAPAVPDTETVPQQHNASSFDWDDNVAEMESGASWTAPAVVGKLRRFLS